METELEKYMDKLMEDSNVVAAVCVDDSGFTVSHRGVTDHNSVSAAARDIITLAKKLERNSSEVPTVILKNGDFNTLITQDGFITTALQKKTLHSKVITP